MTLATLVTYVSLGVVTLSCWLGAVGMRRMREPTQALHFLSLPGGVGAAAMFVAVAVAAGATASTVKAALIALLLMGANPIVTHASARAFRVRKLGHWEPRPGDAVEPVAGAAGTEPTP